MASIQPIVTALQTLQQSRYSAVSSGALLIYHHLSTFDQEVFLIWTRWTLVSFLFLLRRYYNVFVVIYNLTTFLSPEISEHTCLIWGRWQDGTAVITTIITEMILQMRLYAMYERSLYMLTFLATCLTLSITTWAVLVAKLFATGTATVTPFGPEIPIHFCVLNFDSNIAGGYYLSLLIMETILFGLAIYKGLQYFKPRRASSFAQRQTISDVLLRDSIMYFFIIFVTYLVAALYWFIGGAADVELPAGFVVAISSIMSEKLVLNIRQHYIDIDSLTQRSVFSLS